MATSLTTSPLKDFKSLNPSVYIYKAVLSDKKPENDPDVILLCGWMDGTPRHISKYTTPYGTTYPNTTIIVVITTVKDAVFSRTHQNITRITPVVTQIASIAKQVSADESRDARILLHSFSNGGGYSAMLILQQWRELTGKAMNIQAMILDSSPGIPTLSRTVAAMSVSLPKFPLFRFLGILTLRLLYVFFIIAYTLSRRVDWVTRMRATHNDERFVKKAGRRVYVFSEEDEMVDWRDVVKHADEAEEKGYKVRKEMFVGSGHVSHMILQSERYWKVVKETWEVR